MLALGVPRGGLGATMAPSWPPKSKETPVGPLDPPRELTWAGRGHGDGLPPPAVSLRGYAWVNVTLAVTSAVEVVMVPVDLWSRSLG